MSEDTRTSEERYAAGQARAKAWAAKNFPPAMPITNRLGQPFIGQLPTASKETK